MWDNEKMLVLTIFLFIYNLFKRLLSKGHEEFDYEELTDSDIIDTSIRSPIIYTQTCLAMSIMQLSVNIKKTKNNTFDNIS